MSQERNKISHWKAWVVAGLAALLWLPMLVDYFTVLQEKAWYKLWPLLAIAVIVIFVVRWRRAPAAEGHSPRWIIWGLFLLAMALMLFSLLYYVPYVAMMGFILIMGVGALYVSSFRRVENLLGQWLLLLFFLRPPYQVSLRLMTWMENLSITTASKLLDYGGTMHAVQGNVLAIVQHDFRIDAICSGWVSLVSMLACAAVVCVVRNRHFFHAVLFLLAALLSTWVLNVLRILIVTNFEISYGLDLTEGVYLGYYILLSFLMGMVLVLCADALVVFLFSRVEKDVVDNDTILRAKSPFSRLWMAGSNFEATRVLSYFASSKPLRPGSVSFLTMMIMLAGLLGLEATVKYYRTAVTRMEFMYQDEGELTKFGGDSLVVDRDGWELVDYDTEKREFNSLWGALSNTWRLKYNGLTVTMSLDYPFHEWHDVKRCYYKVGWKLVNERIISKQPVFKWPVSETAMTQPNGDAGYILCSNCDHLGDPVMPKPAKHDHTMLLYRLQPSQMTPPFGTSYNQDRRTLYQTQCMVSTPLLLDEATKQEIQLMYADFREQIRKQIAARSQQNRK